MAKNEIKCPKCNKDLVIIWYMEPNEIIKEYVNKKKIFYGGLELNDKNRESEERIIYHCYNCNLSYSKNLKIAIPEEYKEYPYEYVENLVDNLANRVIATMTKEGINNLRKNNEYSHFGIGLWIRNNFIHLNNNIKYRINRDDLGNKVFDRVIEKILKNPEIKCSGKIIIYKINADINKIKDLSIENLNYIAGMMTRIYLKNGDIIEGFGNPEENDKNYFYLWTWDNLNEDTGLLIGSENEKYRQTLKKVLFNDIDCVECIMYSNPRWGCKLTNKFNFYIKDNCEITTKSIAAKLEIPEFLKNKEE